MIQNGMNTSITGRAINAGLLSVEAVNIRDYAFNKHQKVDDYTYGGGAGMLMQAEPVYLAYEAIAQKAGKRPRVVYLTPQGQVFNQQMARDMAKEEDLVFLCGHYEGIDERVLEEIVTDYVSIGDYVLTGGELPAMVMMDSISRMVPGVLSNQESGENRVFRRKSSGISPVQPAGRVAWEKGSGGSHVRSSCKYREVAQRAVHYPYCEKTPGSAEKGRPYQQRMEFCAAAEKAVERGGIQR